MMIKNYNNPESKTLWHSHNIIINGKLNFKHLLMFIIMCFFWFGNLSSIFMTMYFSHIAGVNVGVITTIWSVQPLIAAFIDYLVNREVIGFHHFVGMILIVLGAISIGYTGTTKVSSNHLQIPNHIQPNTHDGVLYAPEIHDQKAPVWIAIMWGFITPCFFLGQSFYTKYIT